MDHETRLRLIEMYTNLLNYTYMNYIQTNNTIQQIEHGIRELIRQNGYDLNTPNYTSTPLWSSRPNLYNPVSSRIFGSSAGGAGPSAGPNAGPNPHTGATAGTGANVRTRVNSRTNATTNRVNRPARARQNSYRSTHDLYTPIFTAMFNVDNLTPVVVRPTASHIENATERISFNENMVHTSCPITQSPFQSSDRIMRIRHCGHCFMEEGLNAWFRQSVRCPVCRHDIRTSLNTPNIDASANVTATTNASRNINNTIDVSRNYINTNTSTNTNTMNLPNMTTSPSIDNLLSLFTNQISDTFRQYLVNNDGSYNSVDNGTINVEYIIHPPTNLYTTQATTARLFGDNTAPIRTIIGNNNSNSNNMNNNNNDDTDTYSDNSETEHDTDNDNV